MLKFKTIVTGHGKFATGIQAALELLAGPQANMAFVDFTERMRDDQLAEQLKSIISNDPTLVFTDLIGGTPYNEASKIAFENPCVAVVAGCNLSSLLESLFNDYSSLPDYAQSLVDITNKTVQKLDLTLSYHEDGIIQEDGI